MNIYRVIEVIKDSEHDTDIKRIVAIFQFERDAKKYCDSMSDLCGLRSSYIDSVDPASIDVDCLFYI